MSSSRLSSVSTLSPEGWWEWFTLHEFSDADGEARAAEFISLGTYGKVSEGRNSEEEWRRTKDTLEEKKDPNIVSWDGKSDPENPKNWTTRRKWAAIFVVSLFSFISPVSSSMVAPSLPNIAAEFNISGSVESQLVMSIFLLAFAVGPLFVGPLSEMYGRVVVLQGANLFYLAFNIACGFARTKEQMLLFRFLSGLGGSAPLVLGGGVISDLFEAHQRGQALGMYTLAPLLGPAVGPIAGGFITETTTWRWTFWATSIADAVILLGGLFLLQETYAPELLSRKCEKLKKATGNPNLRTQFYDPTMTFTKKISGSLVRPFRMLGTQPIVQCLAIYVAYLNGLFYLVLSTFPMLWTERYNEPIGIASLNYISLGIGAFLGSQIAARINDYVYGKLRNRHKGVGRPEFRVPLMIIGSALVPIGLLWYGWAALARAHWILPNIGIALFTAGTQVCFQCIQAYLVDAYTRFAASALAAVMVLRSLAGFGFPLFAPAMYAKLDYGWGNSVLAFVAIGLGMPAPFALWTWGQALRARSKFAAGPDAK